MISRVPFTGGLSFALPVNVHAAYPQGIDSSVMQIAGDGFEIMLDDYGGWRGPASQVLGGREARMSERRAGGCREQVWEVELPTTNPAMLECPSPSPRAACVPMPARASISTFCTTDASCRAVDAIIDSARFTPLPGQALPRPDERWTPPAPVCRIEDKQ
jgi:hypothetical protein